MLGAGVTTLLKVVKRGQERTSAGACKCKAATRCTQASELDDKKHNMRLVLKGDYSLERNVTW